jgi:hypothetical protein
MRDLETTAVGGEDLEGAIGLKSFPYFFSRHTAVNLWLLNGAGQNLAGPGAARAARQIAFQTARKAF